MCMTSSSHSEVMRKPGTATEWQKTQFAIHFALAYPLCQAKRSDIFENREHLCKSFKTRTHSHAHAQAEVGNNVPYIYSTISLLADAVEPLAESKKGLAHRPITITITIKKIVMFHCEHR